VWAATAGAQTSTTTSDEPTRPALPTFDGDAGLWYTPTADLLARKAFMLSLYRQGVNYVPGFTNVGDFAATFAYGINRRAEFFTSFKLITRIDRDTRPLYQNNAEFGGVTPRNPFVTSGWSGNQLGDWTAGIKIGLLSQADQKPASVAFRAAFKIPTGDKDAGASTG
jgi:hypothetical protein